MVAIPQILLLWNKVRFRGKNEDDNDCLHFAHAHMFESRDGSMVWGSSSYQRGCYFLLTLYHEVNYLWLDRI